VVEEDAVDREHAVSFAVVLHYPEPVLLGHTVRAPGIERRRLALRDLLHLSEEFGGGSLVDAAPGLHSEDADGLAASAENIGRLLNRKNVYFVPFGQDAPDAKPTSLSLDYDRLVPAIQAALRGAQLQPILA